MNLTIAAEAFDSPDGRSLIADLDAGLAVLYPPEQRFGPNLKADQVAGDRGIFLIAREGTRAVGCGALRFIDPETAEVKRMFCTAEHRGRGVGYAVLEALETEARRRGSRRLVLETGIHQPAAIRLYLRFGFIQVDCWGEYLSASTSVCYEKLLSGLGPGHSLPSS